MARLWSSGLELNTTTSNVEGLFVSGTNSIVTSVVRSGSYGFRTNPTTSSGLGNYVFQSSDASGVFFGRVYLRIASLPTSDTEVCTFFSAGALGHKVGIRVTTTGVAQLRNIEDSAQVGSDGPTLSTNTWYLVELKIDTSTLSSTVVEGKIDGTSFASGTINLANHVNRFTWGVQTSATADFYFDDIAVNDSSGSFQNSYPGAGKIIHLKPNAAGDNTDWTNTYASTDEVTPDDATTLISSNTLDQISDFNIESSTMFMRSNATVNVVQVGVRFNGVGASANASFVLRVKASASGTVEESSAITPSNTTWVTNAAAAPRNYSLTLYDLPGASTTAWTRADLESAQIGVRLSATSTNAAQVSTLWMLVDYTDGAASGTPMKIKVGSYTGTGSSNAITGVGFQPDAVIIKGGASIWQLSTSTMGANNTKPMTGASAVYSGGVTSLDSDGFTLGTNAAVNTNTTVYYYIALQDNENNDCLIASYTGTGVARAMRGIGFQPDLILFAPASGDTPGFRTSDMAADSYLRPETLTNLTSRVTALDADGFNMGNTNEVNKVDTAYHIVAIKSTTSLFETLTYTGDGADDRTLTGAGFQPDAAFTRNGSTSTVMAGRFTGETGDNSFLVDATGEAADRIQAFTADGFQVGTAVQVNENTSTFYAFVFKSSAGGGEDPVYVYPHQRMRMGFGR